MRIILAALAAAVLSLAANVASAQSGKIAAMPEANFPFIGKTCTAFVNGGKTHYAFTWDRQDGAALTGTLVIDNWRQYAEPVTATIKNGRIVGKAHRPGWRRSFDLMLTPTGMSGEVKGVDKSWTISGMFTCS